MIQNIVGIITSPSKTFKKVLSEKPIGQGGFILGVSFITSQIISNVLSREVWRSMSAKEATTKLSQIPTSILIGLIYFTISLVVIYAIARLLGGKGALRETFLAFSFGNVPYLFSAFLLLFILVPPFLHLPKTPTFIIYSLGMYIHSALAVWVIVLTVIGLKIAHDFSYARASISVLAPPVALLIILFLRALVRIFVNFY